MAKSSNPFNLKELLSQRSLQQEERQEQQEEGLESLKVDVYDLIPSEENFYSTEKIEELKQLIKAFGVLQPLLIKPEGSKYKVIAGHCRRLACMELVKEGEGRFNRVPCVIRTENEDPTEAESNTSKILNKLLLIAANKFREKTEWEKMEEVLQQEELVSELKKESNLSGRVRAMLAELTGVKESKIGRYKAIKNNLCPELMEEFKADHIGYTVIYEASGLSLEYQKEAFESFMRYGVLTGADIQNLKSREKKEQQISGQIEWPEEEQQEGQQAEEEALEVQEATEEPQEGRQEEEEAQEQEEPERPLQISEPPAEEKQAEEPRQPVIYVQQERPEVHGCGFCHPEHHREISSQQGNFLLAYEPETKLVQILNKDSGEVETIIFHRCPMCGREL